MTYHLAIDIGASSGRAIISYLNEKQEIILEEIYRFKNLPFTIDGFIYWDIDALFNSIIESFKKCASINKIPKTFSIDTFGVDYALLDKNDQLIKPISAYRDEKNIKAKEKLNEIINDEKLYSLTGIYPHAFNTIFQLYDDYLKNNLADVKTILFIPSYLYFLLTGEKYNELSFASTSGLLNYLTHDYDPFLLSLLHLDKNVFAHFKSEGEKIGHLKKEIQSLIGFDCIGVMDFTHDTASAVYASNIKKKEVFLSSGTWSLMGVLLKKANPSIDCFIEGFTNELNDIGTVRFLKNINGMYIINRIKDELSVSLTFDEIVKLAKNNESYDVVIDVNDQTLLSPKSMIQSIKDLIIKNHQPLFKNLGELFYCVYHSLVISYKKCIEQIEKLNNEKYDRLIIFGGGSQNLYLNKLIEKYCLIEAIIKEKEATAIGNILSQIKYEKSSFKN